MLCTQTSEKTMTMIMMMKNLATKSLGMNLYSSVDTMKLGKTFKNVGNFLAKIVKKSIFSKMKLAGLLMKKHTSFPSKICRVLRSKRTFKQYLKFHAFSILEIQLTCF